MVVAVPSGEIIDDERVEQIKWNTLNARRHGTLATLSCSVVAVSNAGRNAVTGDCQGAVKLYSYPPEQSGTTVSTFTFEWKYLPSFKDHHVSREVCFFS